MRPTDTLVALLARSATLDVSKTLDGRAVSVSSQDFSNFKEYIQWSSAAYCNVGLPAGATLSCAGGGCPYVTSSGATIVQSLSGSGTGIEGFVAVDHSKAQVVVSFRGSSNLNNWIANLLFGLESCNLFSDCQLHDGFSNAWDEVSTATFLAVGSALTANPNYSLVATGHSLGGAIATIAAAYLRDGGYPCDLYTYGSPRVGNWEFAHYVSDQAGGEFRVTHLDDPIPRLPPMLFGYRHTNVEYWLAGGDSETIDYDIGDIEICEGVASTDCNAGTGGLNTESHDNYLQDVGGCDVSAKIRLVKESLEGISEEDAKRIIELAEADIKAVASGEILND